MPRRLSITIAALLIQWSYLAGKPPGPLDADNVAKVISFDAALDEIRAARFSDEWTQPGWKPKITMLYLADLLAEVKRATKCERLKLPIDVTRLTPADRLLTNQHGRLHVVQDAKLPSPDQCLILADGNLHIARAENCVIIARGAVCLGNSRNNVILAGHYLSVAIDKSDPLPTRAAAGQPAAPSVGLLMSGGCLGVGSFGRSICCGLNRMELRWSADPELILLNCPPPVTDAKTAIRMIEAPQVPFYGTREISPLEGKLQIVKVLTGRIAVRHQGFEYELRCGGSVTDVRGNPLRRLEGWTLNFIAPDYALFTDGSRWAGHYVPP